jgi:hypothetical protein
LDSAFFVIETPPLLNGVNNSTANVALPNKFMITLPTLFEHYSQNDKRAIVILNPSFVMLNAVKHLRVNSVKDLRAK